MLNVVAWMQAASERYIGARSESEASRLRCEREDRRGAERRARGARSVPLPGRPKGGVTG